jgi:hypothetical protein
MDFPKERNAPTNVRNQITNANQPEQEETDSRKRYPVAFARKMVHAAYIPMGKTLLQAGGS